MLKEKKVLNTLSELALNILKQNIAISPKERKKLLKFSKELLLLVKRGREKRKQKALTGQKGGQVLSALLKLGLPILASILFSKTTNGSDD